jgi:hypothetical protein
LGASALAVACRLIVPLGGDDGPRPSTGGPDAAIAGGGIDPCGPIPKPLEGSIAPSQEPLRFVMARWAFISLEEESKPDFCTSTGFDLDGKNTAPLLPDCPDQRSCAPPDAARMSAFCDEVDGVDNALGEVARGALKEQLADTIDPNGFLATGAVNVLLQLSDWNRERNDDSVTLASYASAGYSLFDAGSDPAVGVADIAKLPKVWDGGQSDFEWTVDETSVDASVLNPRFVATGFVRDDVLVIPATGPGIVPFASSTVVSSQGTLMAKIVRFQANGGDHFRLTHGRLGASVPSSAVLNAAGALATPGEHEKQLCLGTPQGTLFYSLTRAYVCPSLDMPADGGPPNADLSCGNVSVGMRFVAVEGRFARSGGQVIVRANPLQIRPPCYDDGGTSDAGPTVWCDDCQWDSPRRCPTTQ